MIDEILREKREPGALSFPNKIDTKKLGSFATNFGLIALCTITAFVSFWDVKLTINSAFSVGWVALLLYISATTVYNTKYDGGIYKGRETERYKTAISNFTQKRNKITNEDLTDDLRDWCQEYRKKDMENVQKEIVCPYITFQDYIDKYSMLSKKNVKKLDLPKKMKKAIIQANNVTSVSLSADMLMGFSFSKNMFGKRRILPKSGDDKRRADFIENYTSKFIITFLCGFIAISIINDPSIETFIQWIVRMIPVVLSFITGEYGGFKNATEVDPRRLDEQSRLLDMFFTQTKGIGYLKNEKKEAVNSDIA